ncbi:hypothetical protein BD413DRAFT_218702 [Trametes elegans]|nr:hypothetical protein BD413DRAFT_218702 [Trametes elegans]
MTRVRCGPARRPGGTPRGAAAGGRRTSASTRLSVPFVCAFLNTSRLARSHMFAFVMVAPLLHLLVFRSRMCPPTIPPSSHASAFPTDTPPHTSSSSTDTTTTITDTFTRLVLSRRTPRSCSLSLSYPY